MVCQVQQRNASLALALSRHFLSTLFKEPTPAVLVETGVGISTVQPFNIRGKKSNLNFLSPNWFLFYQKQFHYCVNIKPE